MRARVIPLRPFLIVALLYSSAVPALGRASRGSYDSPSERNAEVGGAVTQASLRFGVPEIWIRAFIRAESFGNARAVSIKGAIGLMQLMPSTYAALRSRLSLGPDPFDVHDNITAGVAYMRLLLDRYGVAGMIGAYNAGPARWEAQLAGTRELPAETIGYISRIAPMLGVDAPAVLSSPTAAAPLSPAEAPLFVALLSASDEEKTFEDRSRVLSAIAANPTFVSSTRVVSAGPAQVEAVNSSGARIDIGGRGRTTADDARTHSTAPVDTLFVTATPRKPGR